MEFFQGEEDVSGLPGRCVMTETDTDSAGIPGTGALMGKGRAMKARPDGDPLPGQISGQNFRIAIRNKRHGSTLIFSAKQHSLSCVKMHWRQSLAIATLL